MARGKNHKKDTPRTATKPRVKPKAKSQIKPKEIPKYKAKKKAKPKPKNWARSSSYAGKSPSELERVTFRAYVE